MRVPLARHEAARLAKLISDASEREGVFFPEALTELARVLAGALGTRGESCGVVLDVLSDHPQDALMQPPVTFSEAARRTGLDRGTLRAMADRGELLTVQAGKYRRVLGAEIDRLTGRTQ